MEADEKLIDSALKAHQLLEETRGHGDVPDICRDVDFYFYARDQPSAEMFSSFITDTRYGRPTFRLSESSEKEMPWRVVVVINTPATDNLISSLIGFMECLGMVFDVEYDGWSTPVCRRE